MSKNINELRQEIDNIDKEMINLFEKRMNIAKDVGDYKRENNLAILDESREQAIIEKAKESVSKDLTGEVSILMRSLMALSREYQRNMLLSNDEEFLPPPSDPVIGDVKCVFQGVSGAWSEQAAMKLFPDAKLSSVEYFEDVFAAVKKGDADYGVVPIENSQSGAIGETYDLLRKFGCYVVGRTWIDIKQCLLAKKGTDFSQIRMVLSHPEGFRQCRRFLSNKSWDLITCTNTAVAAKKVKGSEGTKTAAIGSRHAAELNDLELVAADIMDSAANRTSFVVIAKNPEYNEKSNLISITFAVMHRSGSLCEALLPFMASGVNLTRIESRPADPGNYRFFAELAGNITDPLVIETLNHASGLMEYLEVLGCYDTIE